MQPRALPTIPDTGENPAYLQDQLITYIGNKRALLPFIGQAVHKVQHALGSRKLRILDLFSGTGIVSRYLKRFASHLIANDLETYSRITNDCYLTNASTVDHAQLASLLATLHQTIQQHWTDQGLICRLYAPRDEAAITPDDRVFYTRHNAAHLDTARLAIQSLPAHLQKFFLAPLIAQASIHANTSGVFKGFYKNASGTGQFGGSGQDALNRILAPIQLTLPIFSRFDCDLTLHQQDANHLVQNLPELDLAYFDPPYNQHPYGSNYFMLNVLADYAPPTSLSRVSGIPTHWNRSAYNKRAAAADTLFNAIDACPARFILISYNSEGFIPQPQFTQRLQEQGRIDVCETRYNTFRGSRNLRQRPLHVTEFLYLLNKR